MGDYTKFIIFFLGPNSSKSAKNVFVGGLRGWAWWVGILLVLVPVRWFNVECNTRRK